MKKIVQFAVATVLLPLLQISCSTAPKTGTAGSFGGQYSGHGVESVSPEIISRYAPPTLPGGLADKVRKLLEVQAPGMGMLSPDHRAMYFTWNVSGSQQIWKIDHPLGFPEQLTSGADRTWLADITMDGKNLIVQRDRAGEENPGLYLMPADGGPLTEIQQIKGVQTYFEWSSMDSQTIYFRANDIQPDSYALYSYSLETKKKELLVSEPGLWFIADVKLVGADTIFLVGRETGALTREYYSFSITDRKLIPLLGQGEKEQYSARFATTPNDLFVLTSKFSDYRRLYRLHEGKFEALTPDVKKDVESFDLPFNRSTLYINWNDHGVSRVEVRDPSTMKVVSFPEFPNASQVYVGSLSRMGRFATLGVETNLAPRTSYVYDWRDNKLTQWVRPSLPEVDRTRFSDVKIESYPARDGTLIPMLVTRPARCEKENCPVIVHFHGGPEGQSRPGFNRTAQLFASEGFIFVEPNVRGSEGYGKAWLAADDGPKRLNVITDIEDCSFDIRRAWARDGRAPKVGVMGWSYGGYSTLMAMTMFAGAYDAGVALVGMSNLRSFLLNTAPYRRSLRISEYGDPEKDKTALEKLSATTYLDRVRDPLMIVQGASDPRVPVGEALQMKNALDKRGVEAPLIIFADEGHGSAKRENKVLELGNAVQFFEKHLK